jgi:hypothetical protein
MERADAQAGAGATRLRQAAGGADVASIHELAPRPWMQQLLRSRPAEDADVAKRLRL